MKRLTILSALLGIMLMSTRSYAQTYTYHHIPDSTAEWHYYLHEDYPASNPPLSFVTPVWHNMSGDTVLAGKKYKIISNGWMYMREDSSRKVYAKTYSGSSFDHFTLPDTFEHLVFDFNMHVGDTLADTTLHPTPHVSSIDTIDYLGTLRRRYRLGFNTWIEGIGCLNGLIGFRKLIVDLPSYCLATMFVNGVKVYDDSLSCSRPTFTTGIDEVAQGSIKISPNPAQHTLNIYADQPDISQVTLYDISGQELLHQNAEGKQTLSLNIASYASGVYLVCVIKRDGGRAVYRFIKE
jgi:Secretion system C-terminal sorting domain